MKVANLSDEVMLRWHVRKMTLFALADFSSHLHMCFGAMHGYSTREL